MTILISSLTELQVKYEDAVVKALSVIMGIFIVLIMIGILGIFGLSFYIHKNQVIIKYYVIITL